MMRSYQAPLQDSLLKVFLILIVICCAASGRGEVIYVDAGASSGNNGSS